MVSGFLSPGVEKAAYPGDAADYLDSIDYRIDVNAKLGHREDKSDFVDDAHETLNKRYEAFDHYLEEGDWDLFFGVFMTTDRVNHFLFGDYENDGEYREEFLEFYAQVDDYIGRLREAAPEDVTFVVASDHGFTSERYEVHLNRWLEREGWLSFEDDDHESLADIDDDTRAYAFVPGRFYLNLEGREPRGVVPEEDYYDVRDELKAAIESIEGPDGEPVVERVVEKEDAFAGEHDEIAPDLVAIPEHGFDLKAGFRAGEDAVFDTGPRNGMHSFENATLITDDPRVSVDEVNLFDLTPTMLDLMDVEFDATAFDGGSLVKG